MRIVCAASFSAAAGSLSCVSLDARIRKTSLVASSHTHGARTRLALNCLGRAEHGRINSGMACLCIWTKILLAWRRADTSI